MDADGSNVVRLTDDPDDDFSPDWSPDGTLIAFTSERDGNREIYVMNSDGSNQVRLTDDPEADSGADWSPDGTRIAFTSERDGNREIYVMDADGSNLIRVTDNLINDYSPDWRPAVTEIDIVPTPEPIPMPDPEVIPTPTEVVLVFDSEPVGMNYLLHLTSFSDTPIRDNMVDPLTWQSGIPEDNLKMVPTTMITGWENIDETTWRFFLRPGIKFHNGELLTAENALPSLIFQGSDEESTSADYTGNFVPEIVDEMTIDLVCDFSCPIFPRTSIYLNIMPGDYFTTSTEEEKELVNYGAGPYKQVDFNATELTYEAYDDYVEVFQDNGEVHPEFQKAIIPEIRWQWRSEPVIQAAMIAAGEADMAWDVGVDAADIAPAVKQGFAAEGLSMKVMTLGCNWHPELCKEDVRLAIAHAIDCQAIADSIYDGLTTCRGTNEFPGVVGTTPENIAPWTYDPDLSIQLLEDAEYDSSNLITINARAFRVTNGDEIYEAIAGYLTDVGISVQILTEDRTFWLERSRCGAGRSVVEYMEDQLGLEDPDAEFDQRVIDMGLTMNDVYAAALIEGPADFCVPGNLVMSTLSDEILDMQCTVIRNMDCGTRGSYFCDPSEGGAQDRIADATSTVDGLERQEAMQYFADRLKFEGINIGVFDLPIIYAINPDLNWEPRFDRRVRVNTMFFLQ